jgi:hypothetical protein
MAKPSKDKPKIEYEVKRMFYERKDKMNFTLKQYRNGGWYTLVVGDMFMMNGKMFTIVEIEPNRLTLEYKEPKEDKSDANI